MLKHDHKRESSRLFPLITLLILSRCCRNEQGGRTNQLTLKSRQLTLRSRSPHKFNALRFNSSCQHSPPLLHDATNIPIVEIGVLELSRNPENCFAELEQARLAPQSFHPESGLVQTKCFSMSNVLFRGSGYDFCAQDKCDPRISAMRYSRISTNALEDRTCEVEYFPSAWAKGLSISLTIRPG
jgi:Catalase